MMSLHKLTAGNGYTYLIRQVAAADATVSGSPSLEAYYSAKGEAPGQWMGAGMAGVGVTGEVTEQQMKNLFGQGLHPDAQRFEARAIAELPAKGSRRDRARIIAGKVQLGRPFPVFPETGRWREALHEAYGDWEARQGLPPAEPDKQAIRTQVATEMFTAEHHRAPGTDQELSGYFARLSRPTTSAVAGYDLTFSPVKSVSTLWAVAPVDTARLIEAAHDEAVADTLGWLEKAAGYTRKGAHGVAQVDTTGFLAAVFTHRDSRAGDPDLHTHVAVSNKVQTLSGKWLSLDGRMLHRMAVAASERYNTLLEVGLTRRLGVAFAPRDTPPGKRPVREIVGVSAELNTVWSSRRAAIDTVAAQLHTDFLADHGRVPTATERIVLHQEATLATRQTKHEPRSLAEQRALWREQAIAALGSEDALDEMVGGLRVETEVTPVTAGLLAELTEQTLAAVAHGRAHWRESNLLAEALRQVRGSQIDPQRMVEVARTVTNRATELDHSIPIGMDTEVDTPVPAELQRRDGQSVFRMAGNQLYTTPAVLAAEQRLVAFAGQHGARTITTGDVEIAALEWSANNDGRQLNPAQAAMVVDIATTDRPLMLALAPAGTGKTTVMGVLAAGWQSTGGTVLGLAPQASAAQELAAAIPGVDADTLDKLTHDLAFTPQDQWQPWMRAIGPDTLVIIDEAGLASTPKLDTAVSFLTARGGRVVLLGDDQQRAANGAGGVLRDIEAAHGALTLTDVMRFTDPRLGSASLALREGDPSVTGLYVDRGELHAATPASVADQVHTAWAADIADGADSIMIGPTLDLVAQLNAKARAGRIAAGQVSGAELTLPNGDVVAAGDVIVTKRNKRVLSLGGTDFVRNNYRWTVTQIGDDGSITATETRRGVTRTIPAWYVKQGHIRLGYAHTHASVQGMTVGKAGSRRGTAHLVVTDGMTRNDLYPGLTRAADGTHAYVITPGTGDGHDLITPGAVLPPSVVETFAAVLGRDGTPRSVLTEMREAADPARRLGPAADAYRRSIEVAAQAQLGPDGMAAISAAAELAVPGVTTAPAWDTLAAHLAVLAADGLDPAERLRAAAAIRELDTAEDLAAVLDYRLDPTGNHSQQPGPLPWLPTVPGALAAHPDWGTYLHARSGLVDDLAGQVSEQAAAFTVTTAPAWALPYLADPRVLVDLALWRASHSIPEDDLRPAGEKPRTIAGARRHRQLVDRAIAVAGDPADGADRWAAQLAGAGIDVADDDYWPVLAARLSAADVAGAPVAQLLDEAVNDRAPLPTEVAAGALWWRIADRLGPDASRPVTGHRLAPAWARHLGDTLGDHAAAQIVTDRLWPVIVAQVDRYERTPHPATEQASVDRIVADAAGMLAAHGPMRPSELAPTLLANLHQLLDLDDQAPDDAPLDPDDADLHAPDDAYPLIDQHHTGAAEQGRHTLLVEPDEAEPTLAADPFDPDRLADTGHVDPNLGVPDDIRSLTEPDELAKFERDYSGRGPDDEPPVDLYDDAPPPDREWAAPPEAPAADDTAAVELDTAPAPEMAAADHAAAIARARAALDAAHTYWRGQVAGSWVPDYITSRGLDPEPFGHAPAGWTTTTDHLTQLGFTRDEQLAAGLVRRSSRGTYIDQFRDRAILPITEPGGDVTGFIGRKAPTDLDDRNPKYLNSPGTELFNKSKLLYGLTADNVAALQAGADLFIVEGPMDAEAINQAHRDPDTARLPRLVAVATSGTALTADHLATLQQVAPLADRQVLVVMDNDPAGDTAAVRASDVLAAAGVHHAATIVQTTTKDASQLLQQQGPDGVRAAMADRRPLEDLVVDRIVTLNKARWSKDDQFHNAGDRIGTMHTAARAVAAMPTDQQHRQTMRIAEKLDLSLFTVMDKVNEEVDALPPKPPTPFVPAYPGDLGVPTPPTLRTRTTPPAEPDPGTDTEQGDLQPRNDPGREHAPFDRPPTPISQRGVDGANIQPAGQPGTVATVDPTPEHPVVDTAAHSPSAHAVDIAPQPLPPTSSPIDPSEHPAAADHPTPSSDLLHDPVQIPESRPYLDLPDAVLQERASVLAADQRRQRQAVLDTADYADRTQIAAETDQGEAVNRLRRTVAALRQDVADIDTYREAIAETQQARAASQATAEQSAAARTELDGLGRFSGARKADLSARIEQLTAARQAHQQRMVAAAKTAAVLQAKVGTQKQQDRIRAAAAAAQSNASELITQARETDARSAHEARAVVDQIRDEHQGIADDAAALTAEQQHRVEHPDPAGDQARQQAYVAEQARIAAEEPDAADPYTQDPYAYDPTQEIADVTDFGMER